MPEITPNDADRLDLLLRLLAQEADHCDRTAQTEHARAEELRRELNRGFAGYALGYAQANEDFARYLRGLLVDATGAIAC